MKRSLFPEGAARNLFQPLDPYFEELGMEEEGLWDDMSDIIEGFKYKDQHYVVPYALSEPYLLTYSRSLFSSQGMEDPYTLYKEGRWDWNALTTMINRFIETETSAHHFGISGFYGEAILSSTGHTVNINFLFSPQELVLPNRLRSDSDNLQILYHTFF